MHGRMARPTCRVEWTVPFKKRKKSSLKPIGWLLVLHRPLVILIIATFSQSSTESGMLSSGLSRWTINLLLARTWSQTCQGRERKRRREECLLTIMTRRSIAVKKGLKHIMIDQTSELMPRMGRWVWTLVRLVHEVDSQTLMSSRLAQRETLAWTSDSHLINILAFKVRRLSQITWTRKLRRILTNNHKKILQLIRAKGLPHPALVATQAPIKAVRIERTQTKTSTRRIFWN